MRGKFSGKFLLALFGVAVEAGCSNFFKVPTIVLVLWRNTFLALENGLNVPSILIRCVSHFVSSMDISTTMYLLCTLTAKIALHGLLPPYKYFFRLNSHA